MTILNIESSPEEAWNATKMAKRVAPPPTIQASTAKTRASKRKFRYFTLAAPRATSNTQSLIQETLTSGYGKPKERHNSLAGMLA